MSTHRTFLAIAATIATLIAVIAPQAQTRRDETLIDASLRPASGVSGIVVARGPMISRHEPAAPLFTMPPMDSPAQPSVGLVINGVFDSSITSNANSAAIMAAINSDIAFYQSTFSDPITVKILYRYANTFPDGSPIANGGIAVSNAEFYGAVWASYMGSLTADSKTTNDAKAIASLPASAPSTLIRFSSASGRAIGRSTPGGMCPDGTVTIPPPVGCNYDGIVTIVSTTPFSFSRPVAGGTFDARAAIQHEMDEVLGFGSGLNFNNPIVDWHPSDLFSYSAPATRNVTSTGTRYLSIDGGTTNLVGFNQVAPADYGDFAGACPHAVVHPQDAFACAGETSDIAANSPEGILLDAIGYDLVLGTTAANVPISGRVLTSSGAGLRAARVTLQDSRGNTFTALTNSFGYYTFTNVPTGDTYIATASARRSVFAPRVVSVNDVLVDLDLIAR
ncbi:MAG: NF038122 family metalloprotease [Pyrinomonadaceae bacterium]